MSEDVRRDIENIAEVLTVLVAEGNYTYVDKIGNAPSRDLLIFYLKEAFRGFHSLLRGGGEVKAKELLDKIKERMKGSEPEDYLNKSLDRVVSRITDRRSLREVSAMISAKALAISSKYVE